MSSSHNKNNMIQYVMLAKQLLNWRYGEAESAIGISSSWNSIINQALGVSHFDPYGLSNVEQAIEATRKISRIENALNEIPKHYSIVLYGTYGGHRFPKEISKFFGEHAACSIILQKCSIDTLRRLCRIKGHTEQELALLKLITRQSKDLFLESHLAFLKAYKQQLSKDTKGTKHEKE